MTRKIQGTMNAPRVACFWSPAMRERRKEAKLKAKREEERNYIEDATRRAQNRYFGLSSIIFAIGELQNMRGSRVIGYKLYKSIVSDFRRDCGPISSREWSILQMACRLGAKHSAIELNLDMELRRWSHTPGLYR